MPHGRDDEAAAATGLGTKTTDHQQTDGVGLATPANGPRVDQKVIPDLVKPLPPPSSVASTTPPKRTQPHRNGRVVVDRDDDDEGVERDPCENGDEERRPGTADEPPNEAQVKPRDRADVKVEPGRETIAGQNRDVTHECADAGTDDRAEEAHGAVQVEGENAKRRRDVSIAGERVCATAHVRSTTADENDQQDETAVDDIPEDPPDPSPLSSNPAQRQTEPQSVELEGERCTSASFDIGLTSAETNMSGVPGGVEDARKRPRKLRHASERERERPNGRTREYSPEGGRDDRGDPRGEAHASPVSGSVQDVRNMPMKLHQASKRVRERSEPKEEKNSPSRPREEPYNPGGETAIPGGIHNVQERPKGVRNERVDGKNAPSRDTGSGGHLEVQGSSKDVEGNPDSANVAKRARYDGKRPKSVRNERDVDTNTLRRVRGPGGHSDEEDESGDDDEQEHQSDGDGVETDGTGCRTHLQIT